MQGVQEHGGGRGVKTSFFEKAEFQVTGFGLVFSSWPASNTPALIVQVGRNVPLDVSGFC